MSYYLRFLLQRVFDISALLKRFILYAGIGVIGTAGHFAVLIVLVDLVSFSPSAGSSFGFIVGAIINYLLNYQFTFQSDKQHLETLPKFLTIAIVGFFLNGAIMLVGTEWLSLHYLLMQVLATTTTLFASFAGNYLWTFKE
jgi:putative flippase GtrA